MQREAPRTLFTLSETYQRLGERISYEVLVVENGSSKPLDASLVTSFGAQFRYIYYETGSASPVDAMHEAVIQSRGKYIVMMNDAARILSPRILEYMNRAVNAFNNPVVAVPGYHLGPATQDESMAKGYNQEVENRLLDAVPWHQDGYRLFDISTLAGSSAQGWFEPINESNCVAMPRSVYDSIGGICRDFQSPGGGFIALDFFKNAWEYAGSDPVMLLGEGTFHQFHGGTATNAPPEEKQQRLKAMADEYERIRGRPFEPPMRTPYYLGHLPRESARFLEFSALRFSSSSPSAPVPGMLMDQAPDAIPLSLFQRIRSRLSAIRP